MKILLIANSYDILSGGDKIFAQVAKQWIRASHNVIIKTNPKGRAFCLSQGIPPSKIITNKLSAIDFDIIFASSYFPEDLLPALFLKLQNTRLKLITTSYHLIPRWGIDYSGGFAKGFILYYWQRLSLFLMKKYSSLLLTALDKDRDYLITRGFKNVIAIRGGVDLSLIDMVPTQKKAYQAIFVGRLIHQKCIPELIELWESIIKKHPSYVLAIIGEGPLENWLKKTIDNNQLRKNIHYLGRLDNEKKIKIIKSAKIFISVSRYDSGNNALDEALACGIPGMLFDTTKNHYPQGVVNVPCCDLDVFASSFIKLLKDNARSRKLSIEGKTYMSKFTWSKIAENIIKLV